VIVIIVLQDFILFTVLIALSGTQISTAQFPKDCMKPAILQTKRCCPDECGSQEGRGMCGRLSVDLAEGSSVRDAWPYYFDHICICNDNFAGYNCSRCKYGYYGENCNNSIVVERRPISDYSPQEWEEYVNILNMTKLHPSDYMVFLEEPQLSTNPDLSQLPTSNVLMLYDLFVWQHHYPAKDSENEGSYNIIITGIF
jgi:tyrosinase